MAAIRTLIQGTQWKRRYCYRDRRWQNYWIWKLFRCPNIPIFTSQGYQGSNEQSGVSILGLRRWRIHARIQISFSGGGGGGGGVPPKTHSSYYMILWFPDFSGCKPYTRKVNVSSSNHEVSTFWTLFRFMTVVYINAVQYQTCPNHESNKPLFCQNSRGVRTPGPPLWIRPCIHVHSLHCSRIREFNPFSNGKFLDFSKLIEYADDYFNFYENGRKFSERVENTVGKGEIARYERFLLFPQCFQKTCTADR